MERFGDWVRARRSELGLSQGRLAELVGKGGANARLYIANIEKRPVNRRDILPGREILPALSEALQVPLDEVVRRWGAQKAGVTPDVDAEDMPPRIPGDDSPYIQRMHIERQGERLKGLLRDRLDTQEIEAAAEIAAEKDPEKNLIQALGFYSRANGPPNPEELAKMLKAAEKLKNEGRL